MNMLQVQIKMFQYYFLTQMELDIKYLLVPGAIILVIFFLLLFKPKPRQQRLSVKLVDKKVLTHDTIIFTFLLPDAKKTLGLKIGEHLEVEANINGQIEKRKYTPITPFDRVGSFEILLKIYHKCEKFPEGGKMTQYLEALPQNSNININLPFGRFNYLGSSKTLIKTFDQNVVKNSYQNFYMVAGGTGITPIFQIIQYICENQSSGQSPNLYLLFANRTEDDILLQKQLLAYTKVNPKFKCYFSVDKSITEGWEGFEGFINEEKVRKTIPENTDETLFMSCGPPILCNIVEKIFTSSLKIPAARIYRF